MAVEREALRGGSVVLVVEVVFTETQDNAPVATLLEWFAAHHRHVMMG